MQDITGRRFGRLKVLSYSGNYKWKCVCDCGTIKDIRKSDLISGRTTSCGCLRSEKMSNTRRENLTGMRFGRLVVTDISHSDKSGVYWNCKCDCGSIVTVKSAYLKNGDTKSCGCLKIDTISNLTKTHGMSKTGGIYVVWKGMRERCHNTNSDSYKDYGGRGICICEEWEDFSTFRKWAMSNGYFDGCKLSIDRIDVNGNYCPENCRFVTSKTQANNTRRNHLLSFNGVTKTISEWSDITGLPQKLIRNRIAVLGWSVEKALTTEVAKYGR